MRRAWILALFVSMRAFASPEDIYGYGARGLAMGGTGTAHATSYDAAWANPALASEMRRYRLSLGLEGGGFDLHANGGVSERAAKGFVIGGDLPLPFGGVLRDRVGVALAFYTPSNVLVRGTILYPEKPQFPLFPDRTQCLTIRAGFGVDIGHGFRVGAGFGALAQIVGNVIVATDATGKVGSRVEDQLVAIYAPIFGATWEHRVLGGKLRIGAAYRGALAARFAVSIDATKLSSLPFPVLNIAGLAQYDPHELALEAAWEKGSWRAAIGATYKHFSDYPGPWEQTIMCPADSPDCGVLAPPKLSFSDTVVPRAGVEHTIAIGKNASASIRGGWFFEPTPAPDNMMTSQAFDIKTRMNIDVPTRFYDASRSVLTLGGGIRYKDATLDGFAQLHVLVPRDVTIAPGERVTISGSAFAGGLILGVSF